MITIFATVYFMNLAKPQSYETPDVQKKGCHEITLNFEDQPNMTIQQCMNHAQIELAKWAGEHPNWLIARYRCGDASKEKDM